MIKSIKIDGVVVVAPIAKFDQVNGFVDVLLRDAAGQTLIINGTPATERLTGRVEIEWDAATISQLMLFSPA